MRPDVVFFVLSFGLMICSVAATIYLRGRSPHRKRRAERNESVAGVPVTTVQCYEMAAGIVFVQAGRNEPARQRSLELGVH